MATTQITGLNPIGVVNDSDLILIHSGVEDFKGTITDLKTNLNNTYLKITDNLTTVQDKPAAFNAIKQYATTTSSGVLEIADNTETITGTDTSRAVVPSGLKAAMTDRDVLAGNGLTGGGNLGSDVTLNMGTPSTITSTSTNIVTADSHTHAISLTVATPTDINDGVDNIKPVTAYGLANNGVTGNITKTVGSTGADFTTIAAAINYFKGLRKRYTYNTVLPKYELRVITNLSESLYLVDEDLSWLSLTFQSIQFTGDIYLDNTKSPLLKGTITKWTPTSNTNNHLSIYNGSTFKAIDFFIDQYVYKLNSELVGEKPVIDVQSSNVIFNNVILNLEFAVMTLNNSTFKGLGFNAVIEQINGVDNSELYFKDSTVQTNTTTASGDAFLKIESCSNVTTISSNFRRKGSTGNTIRVGNNVTGAGGSCIGQLLNSSFVYGTTWPGSTSSQDIYCGQRSIVMKDGCTGGTASAGTGVVY